MKVFLTFEASIELHPKLRVTVDERLEAYFESKTYSSDLEYLYINLVCMNPTFEQYYPIRKPKYTAQTKEFIHKGVELTKYAKTFQYDLRLDFNVYNELVDIRPQLATDIINSLDTILFCKQIKSVDLDRFKEDFKSLFKEINWI